ncbi:MAG: tRNA (adenine-N1)-methyltransferase, partial [Caldimicrobium sp.]
EKEEKFLQVAKENVKRLGLESRVIFKLREVKESFDEREVDGIFIDLRKPWEILGAAYESLKGGHPLGILVPTANQVSETLKGLKELPFVDIEVVEILLRNYKINPERLRPEDQMIGHTGYLIFAKKVF